VPLSEVSDPTENIAAFGTMVGMSLGGTRRLRLQRGRSTASGCGTSRSSPDPSRRKRPDEARFSPGSGDCGDIGVGGGTVLKEVPNLDDVALGSSKYSECSSPSCSTGPRSSTPSWLTRSRTARDLSVADRQRGVNVAGPASSELPGAGDNRRDGLEPAATRDSSCSVSTGTGRSSRSMRGWGVPLSAR
jgi:hypothetical protein